MALLLQELLTVAADLMLASVLSCLFYAAGCVVVPGLIGYVVVLSCGPGVMKNAKRNISQTKRAVRSTLSDSCLGQAVGKILGLAGSGGPALLHPSEQTPILKEECSSAWSVKQLPAGDEKKCRMAAETLPGSHPSRTGLSGGMKMQPGTIWEEEREASQKKVCGIPAFFFSLLFASLEWCLKKRPFRRLTTLLATLKNSRD